MNIEDIEVEVISTEKTPALVTEAVLRLYENNASKILDMDEEE
ncbi:hypothetical protein [Clostridium oceanicum]|uniref:Uncharacterized protein n=1 Tax=Clostridium oceanicum TaxID=1543 RepID=A0ABN1JBW2_9CLOT